MDVDVDDQRRWINLNFFGDTKFEQAHNAVDSYRFEIRKYGSGMGISRVEHKSFAWFSVFEIKASKTLSQELPQLHVIIS